MPICDERMEVVRARTNCEVCGIEPKRKEVHHIDGDHGNQSFDNLKLVCTSCHKKEHYKMGRVKKGEKGLQSHLERIIEVTFIGIEKVYDVEMEAPNHNFVTRNGIVTCNSHSVSYAKLAFISQTLKIKWPVYFWAANLEWDAIKGDDDKKLSHKKSAQLMGVKFLMPDINKSKASFVVEDNKIRWSLLGIKGIGEKTAKEIESKQPYVSFDDFFDRVHKGIVKVNNMENLIYAGVFDIFGDRKELAKILFTRKDKAVPKLTEESLSLKFSVVF